jgi:hypothetical protein
MVAAEMLALFIYLFSRNICIQESVKESKIRAQQTATIFPAFNGKL